MQLDELQRTLAATLAGHGHGPEGCDERSLDQLRRSLETKRQRAACHLLPRLRTALGPQWSARFHQHAAAYNPSGLLHHVDDAWEMAERLSRDPDPRIAGAAHDDLVSLRLRYTRDRHAGADRIRERTGPLLAVMKTPSRLLVVRMPGPEGKVWYLRV
jgi:hypothetical protein